MVYFRRKEFAPKRSKFFPFRIDPFTVGRKKSVLTELSPLKVYPIVDWINLVNCLPFQGRQLLKFSYLLASKWIHFTRDPKGSKFYHSVGPFSEGNKNNFDRVDSLKSFGAEFQTSFVVCFSFLTKYRWKRSSYVKLKD